MKDVMLDLETLGTRHDALIMQIGACYFDRMTGEIGVAFSANIDPGSYNDKFTVDYDTIKWWMQQSDDARRLVMEAPMSLVEAIFGLTHFLEGKDVTLWSHATFDMPILHNAFQTVGMKNPVPFRNMRDLRTLVDLADYTDKLERDGVHHHALDDAKFQVRYASEAFKKLYGSGK
jgi:hypothetical protein